VRENGAYIPSYTGRLYKTSVHVSILNSGDIGYAEVHCALGRQEKKDHRPIRNQWQNRVYRDDVMHREDEERTGEMKEVIEVV
jgi:hypothetical protein